MKCNDVFGKDAIIKRLVEYHKLVIAFMVLLPVNKGVYQQGIFPFNGTFYLLISSSKGI